MSVAGELKLVPIRHFEKLQSNLCLRVALCLFAGSPEAQSCGAVLKTGLK